MLLNQEDEGRLTIRVCVPYSLICKFNRIRKQKRNTRSTIELTNYTKSYQFYFTFHMPLHYFALKVFLDKVLEDLAQVYNADNGNIFMKCFRKRSGWSQVTKKTPNLSKNYSSINSSFNDHITQNTTVS